MKGMIMGGKFEMYAHIYTYIRHAQPFSSTSCECACVCLWLLVLFCCLSEAELIIFCVYNFVRFAYSLCCFFSVEVRLFAVLKYNKKVHRVVLGKKF